MARLLIVSNRLPVTVTVDEGAVTVQPSAGGLATGLRGPHERSGGLWIGWPGVTDLENDARAEVERRLTALRAVPLWLTAEETTQFYEDVSNGVLWPLFHYLLDQVPLHVAHWDTYVRVNERFADLVAANYQPGDHVWVHDYQLMLLPRLLRERLPEARIGFFLHIPFPSSEVFRILPFREPVLEGLLGADLVGFHTAAYMRHFASAVLRILGLPTEVDRVTVGERNVHLGVFPMGVDARAFASLAGDPQVEAEVEALRGADRCTLLVGIDRLDYTKGIPRRLLAFEELLRREPALRERVRLVQVAVPSRTEVEAYQEFRHALEALVGHVNGAFATPRWAPVHYIYRALSEAEVVTLYRAADVMLVTPLRDGMNLVAKEFVAARTDEDGVLVLSEFAGAAADLAEALSVNPYDVDRAAEVYHRALILPPAERRARMRGLRRRVLTYDVHHWARSFLSALDEAGAEHRAPRPPITPASEVRATLRPLRAASHLVLLLDYDGTLVPFAPVPDLATPDPPLLDLLAALAARPHTEVHVVSGRSHETLERWLGMLPIGLIAEHGFWSRRSPGDPWVAASAPSLEWREPVRAILEQVAARTPGSLVEEKSASLAWHYRTADLEFGAVQANELRVHLTELLSNAPVEVLTGEKVIEVRPHGVSKAAIVAPLVAAAPTGAQVVALGDDRTDEDLFAALPEGAVAVHVGRGPSRAAIRLARVSDARAFLRALLEPAAA
jgi:trehalose 6-phosphate synthase/phosphatase